MHSFFGGGKGKLHEDRDVTSGHRKCKATCLANADGEAGGGRSLRRSLKTGGQPYLASRPWAAWLDLGALCPRISRDHGIPATWTSMSGKHRDAFFGIHQPYTEVPSCPIGLNFPFTIPSLTLLTSPVTKKLGYTVHRKPRSELGSPGQEAGINFLMEKYHKEWSRKVGKGESATSAT